MKKVISQICEGILAGIMIEIGCCVYLACEIKWVGAILFSVALLTICYRGYSLYTGKIGLIAFNHKKEDFSVLLLGLLGNVIATAAFGIIIHYAIPNLGETANALATNKLNQEAWQTLIRGIFCGILMYIAVIVFRENKTPIGILFCIPVFILSGFEHSIADMGYFATGAVFSWKAFGYIWLVILGNTIGALIFPLLRLATKEKKVEEPIQEEKDDNK